MAAHLKVRFSNYVLISLLFNAIPYGFHIRVSLIYFADDRNIAKTQGETIFHVGSNGKIFNKNKNFRSKIILVKNY